MPEAAPGEAGKPFARTSFFALGSSRGCSNWSSEAGSMRCTASAREIRPVSAQSTAIFSAACCGAFAGAGLQHIKLDLAAP